MIIPTIKQTRTEDDFAWHIFYTVQTNPNAGWVFVLDNLNLHCSATLVCYVAELERIDKSTPGIKGVSGILKSVESRQAFLSDRSHRVRFVYLPKHTSWLRQIKIATARMLRVLVVDDNVDTVLSLSMLLNASGHDVRTACDGLSAVQTAVDFKPDVVLLDIGLPVMNGYQVARRIRQEPTLQNIVLIALTGYGQEADRQLAFEAGFNHHLVKPAGLVQLHRILAAVSTNVT